MNIELILQLIIVAMLVAGVIFVLALGEYLIEDIEYEYDSILKRPLQLAIILFFGGLALLLVGAILRVGGMI